MPQSKLAFFAWHPLVASHPLFLVLLFLLGIHHLLSFWGLGGILPRNSRFLAILFLGILEFPKLEFHKIKFLKLEFPKIKTPFSKEF